MVWPGEVSGTDELEPEDSLPDPLVPDPDPELFGPVLLVSFMEPGDDVVLPEPLVPEEPMPPSDMPAQALNNNAEQARDIVHFIIDYSH